MPELRQHALAALCNPNLAQKLAMAHAGHADAASFCIATQAALEAPHNAPLPGRPARPLLMDQLKVPRRSPFTPDGHAALMHAIAHIEFNAINLALDAVWRYRDMPEAYYRDWMRVAAEEATHFGLLRAHLQTLGYDYGDFPAHNGLWEMTAKTSGDIVARMALVPRTLEARGLDATPLIQAKLRKANTAQARAACQILDTILHDEVGHVAIGNHWYRWLCARSGLEPVAHYRWLTQHYQAPRLKPS